MHLSTPKELWKIQYQRAKNIWPTQAASQNWSGLHMMQPDQAWCHCGPRFLLTDIWHPAGYLDLVHHCTEAAKTTPAVGRYKRKCHCSRQKFTYSAHSLTHVYALYYDRKDKMCSLQLYLSAAERWRTCVHCTCNWFTILTFAKLNTLLQLSISFSFLPIFFAFRPGVFSTLTLGG